MTLALCSEDDGARAEDNTLHRRRTTFNESQVARSLLLDSGTRELAEHPRGPLPSHSTRELAGFPGRSLPNASVEELVERNSEDEPLEELGRLAAELNRQLEIQKQKAESRESGPTSGLLEPQVV